MFGEGNAKVFKGIHIFKLFSFHEDLGPDVDFDVGPYFNFLSAHVHHIRSFSVYQSLNVTLQFEVVGAQQVNVISERKLFIVSPSYRHSTKARKTKLAMTT